MAGATTYFVWYDEWQLACCGAAFAVGDEVEWTLMPPRDVDYLERQWPGLGDRVTHTQDHHGADGADLDVLGVVRSIEVAREGRPLEPVDASTRRGGDFEGYVVALEVAAEQPAVGQAQQGESTAQATSVSAPASSSTV